MEKTLLSVNVNKIATLRNARGGSVPNLVDIVWVILEAGAHGITVHPRPDGRHIRRDDVFAIQKSLVPWKTRGIEYNIEGYPSEDFLELVEQVVPEQVTLVPDPPEVLTSNAGWNLENGRSILEQVIPRMHQKGVRVSLFMDPTTWKSGDADLLRKLGPDRVEIYTEAFAKAFGTADLDRELAAINRLAKDVNGLGIALNAGHDLSQSNLATLIENCPQIKEVSIGHALVTEALYEGMTKTVKAYLRILKHEGTL